MRTEGPTANGLRHRAADRDRQVSGVDISSLRSSNRVSSRLPETWSVLSRTAGATTIVAVSDAVARGNGLGRRTQGRVVPNFLSDDEAPRSETRSLKGEAP